MTLLAPSSIDIRAFLLGTRMWIMSRDGIEYNEFCRRGQMQQKSGDACTGISEAAIRVFT